MGRMRALLEKLLDRIDPPKKQVAVAPCPSCGMDVWERNHEYRFETDITFVRCVCGEAAGWVVIDGNPQAVLFGGPPDEVEYL